MIRDNQSIINKLHIFIDAIIVAGSYLLAWYIRFGSGLLYSQWSLPFGRYASVLIYLIPMYIILYSISGLYRTQRISGRRQELASIIKANVIGLLILILVLYLLKQLDFSRTMLFIFVCLNTIIETLVRNIISIAMKSARKKGLNQKYILLVGYSRAAEEFIDRVILNPQWGYVIRGILDDNIERGTDYKGIKIIGEIENLPIILPENQLDEIAITLGINEYSKLSHIVAMCEKSGVHTMFIPDYNNVIPTKPYTEDLQGLPVINIRRVPLNNLFNGFVKRLVDILFALIMIIILSPLMAVISILIKATSKGPLIFKQERIGLHNKSFMMYKFRSMRQQTEEEEKKGWTTKNDPRVTKIGKFIRKTSIDELPQFFNVLFGDMSVIGPRPERPQYVEKFKEEIPRYMVKHQVRPGITGWAQVNGYRGDTSIAKRIEYDLYYIENWTFGFDVKIAFLTVFKGFVNKNAY